MGFWNILKKIMLIITLPFRKIGGLFAFIWRFFCKSKSFARFFYVTLPAVPSKMKDRFGKTVNFFARNRLKIIILFMFCVSAACIILGISVINEGNSDYKKTVNDEIEYGMRVQVYSTFDHSDKLHTAIHLSWTDGILNLEGGSAISRIKAEVHPLNLLDNELEWSVSDEEIAEIDQNGRITAKQPGNVKIYARLVNYDITAEAKLFVRQPVTGIFLPTTTMTMDLGGSARYLDARIFPQNASNKNIKWKSKNTKVATVDQNGTVKSTGTGMTEITVTTEDGDFEAKCFVTVVNPSVDVESITLQNSDAMTLTEGESVTAVVTVSPSNAKNKTLKWTSDNAEVVRVTQTGRITAAGAGSANVTAESVNGIKETFTVTVNAREEEPEIDEEDEETEGGVTYTPYIMTFPQAVEAQMGGNPPPKIWTSAGTVYATEAQAAEYMDPNNYYQDSYKYQFLDLSHLSNVSAEQLNAFLADKGVLQGMGDTFINAAKQYNVNEIYLVAHACLETGNGTSGLAKGVEVEGETVYNVFGIGAYDNIALSSGSLRAHREGWTSIEAAIMGGAKFISDMYVNREDTRQNTLYKMLWNPERPAYHQYATDIGWAVKQAVSIGRIINEFGSASLSYDVPVYNGMIPPVIEN